MIRRHSPLIAASLLLLALLTARRVDAQAGFCSGVSATVRNPYPVDLDNSGNLRKEIAFVHRASLYVSTRANIPRLGFPIAIDQLLGWQEPQTNLQDPMIVDLNGDGSYEIVLVATRTTATPVSRLLVFRNDGTPLAPWPATGILIPSSPSNQHNPMGVYINGVPHIFFSASESTGTGYQRMHYLYVYGPTGTLRSSASMAAIGSELGGAAGDLNNDGVDELVVITGSTLRVLDPRTLTVTTQIPALRTGISNFARFANPRPALGDIDGDGYRDIVVFDESATPVSPATPYFHRLAIRAFNRFGTSLPGFPVTLPNYGGGLFPVLADITGDNKADIISTVESPNSQGTTNMRLFAHTGAGALIQNFPFTFPYSTEAFSSFITATDLTRDGRADLILRSTQTSGTPVVSTSTIWFVSSAGALLETHTINDFASRFPMCMVNGYENRGPGGIVVTDVDPANPNQLSEIVVTMMLNGISLYQPTLANDLPLGLAVPSGRLTTQTPLLEWPYVDANPGNTRSLPLAPTATATPTRTSTPTPSPTPTPRLTATQEPAPTPTATPMPSATPTPGLMVRHGAR